MKKVAKTSSNKRRDVEKNQGLVRDAFFTLLSKNRGRKPTIKELAEECGLNHNTVKKHVKEIDYSVGFDPAFKILTDDVVLSIYRGAMKLNPACQKLWMQIIGGWSEKVETKHSGEIKTDDNKPPVIIKITKQ